MRDAGECIIHSVRLGGSPPRSEQNVGLRFSGRSVKCSRPIVIVHVRAEEFFYARSLMPLESVITVDCTRSFFDISENVSYISTAMNGELWHSCVRSPEKLFDSNRRLTRRLTFVNFARSLATTPEDWCRDIENSVFFSYSLRRLSLSDTDIARFQKWISRELYFDKVLETCMHSKVYSKVH